MSKIGATGGGGINRQALTREDAEARILLLSWASHRNYSASMDAVGNLFIRRPGLHEDLAPVLVGSHLDSQPAGGNFDGVFGVLAGLETLETLDDLGFQTSRSIELVVWMNEEGCRFPPTTMGSSVFAGRLPLDQALAITDRQGVSVCEALASHRLVLPKLNERKPGERIFAYLETHIEQGPILEKKACSIGIVTGIQGLSLFEVELAGDEAHAGTTPIRDRRDALVEAIELIQKLRTLVYDPSDTLRFTIGRFEVSPGSPNTVPGRVYFTIDVRHPDQTKLSQTGKLILETCNRFRGQCTVKIKNLSTANPVRFHDALVNLVRARAKSLGLPSIDMLSGATHDAKFMVDCCPTAMIFIPCKDGISHNEAESARPQDLVAGTQLLCTVIRELAMAESVEHTGSESLSV
jgi:N-carbamoyl-L-amino-acid hydrolase